MQRTNLDTMFELHFRPVTITSVNSGAHSTYLQLLERASILHKALRETDVDLVTGKLLTAQHVFLEASPDQVANDIGQMRPRDGHDTQRHNVRYTRLSTVMDISAGCGALGIEYHGHRERPFLRVFGGNLTLSRFRP